MPALLFALFLSGIAGLVYQMLWLRLLTLSFGVTAYAASTVLAAFMTGLAARSAIASRLGGRVRRPLLWLAVAEASIGLSALLTLPAKSSRRDCDRAESRRKRLRGADHDPFSRDLRDPGLSDRPHGSHPSARLSVFADAG